jgi:hypothetical protein
MATKTQLGIKVRNELTHHIRASDDHLLDPGDAGFVHDRRDALSRDFTALLCQPSVND